VTATEQSETSNAARTFRSLRHRNYRLYFYGQLTSMCGTWAQTVALAWLVLKLTGSGTKVGLVTSVQFMPVLLVGAYAGVVADRFDNRRSVIAVQLLLGAQAALLAAVVLTDVVQMWMVYALAAVQGTGMALDTPTRQSLVGQLVPTDELANAVALNAGLAQMARVVGPAIAGVLIETVGIGACFALNAVSYCVIVALLLFVDPATMVVRPRLARARRQLRDALGYFASRSELRDPLIIAIVVGVFASNFNVVLPLVAKYTFHGGAGTYTAMASAQGVGAVIAALVIASRRRPTKGLLVASVAWLGAALMMAAVAPFLALEFFAVGLAGMMGAATGIAVNASLQLGAPPAMRGRIIALFFFITYGSNVIGGPLMGWIAQTWSARWSLVAGGLPALVLAAWLALRWHARLGDAAATPHDDQE